MRKSLILSWISACDYPLFREWIRKWGVNFFDEILIYWDVQFRYPFYWAFIEQELAKFPEIKFLDPIPVEKDWRHTSTTELINHATGDWIFSIEQDWVCRNWEEHFDAIKESLRVSDFFGWWNPTNNPYIHPAFWAIKRELLEKTSKDFSAHPEINGSDHFAKITYDVLELGAKIDKYEGDVSFDSLHFHLGGINQNYLNGLTKGFQFHRPEIFKVYNTMSGLANVKQNPKFIQLIAQIGDQLPMYNESEGLFHNPAWEPFFKI